jgi:hypothetical protein
MQHLEGDLLAKRHVLRAVDRAEPSGCQPFVDAELSDSNSVPSSGSSRSTTV